MWNTSAVILTMIDYLFRKKKKNVFLTGVVVVFVSELRSRRNRRQARPDDVPTRRRWSWTAAAEAEAAAVSRTRASRSTQTLRCSNGPGVCAASRSPLPVKTCSKMKRSATETRPRSSFHLYTWHTTYFYLYAIITTILSYEKKKRKKETNQIEYRKKKQQQCILLLLLFSLSLLNNEIGRWLSPACKRERRSTPENSEYK